jgi:putative FmdB family regulatory protein
VPLYDIQCSACGHAFETFQAMDAKQPTRCEKCGKKKGPSGTREAAQGPQQVRQRTSVQGTRERLMEFVRKKKRGQNQKVRRTWFSEEGYRIVWRKEVRGVRVPARFQACVRVLVPYSDGQLRIMWDFVNRARRLIKTLKAAEQECERHKNLWDRACEATGIRALRELFGDKLPFGLPLWARKTLDRRLYAILIDTRPMMKNRDDEEAEPCTESLPPASDAPSPGGPISSKRSRKRKLVSCGS